MAIKAKKKNSADEKTSYSLLVKIDKRLTHVENQMATKDDLKPFATKDDLKNLATKGDVKRLEGEIANITVHLVKLENRVSEIEYKMVTKEELMELKSEILNHIDALVGKYKKHDQELVFVRYRFENLEMRVAKLEEKAIV